MNDCDRAIALNYGLANRQQPERQHWHGPIERLANVSQQSIHTLALVEDILALVQRTHPHRAQ